MNSFSEDVKVNLLLVDEVDSGGKSSDIADLAGFDALAMVVLATGPVPAAEKFHIECGEDSAGADFRQLADTEQEFGESTDPQMVLLDLQNAPGRYLRVVLDPTEGENSYSVVILAALYRAHHSGGVEERESASVSVVAPRPLQWKL